MIKPIAITNLPLSKTIHGLLPSATLVINEKMRTMIQNGQEVYRFGFGQSPFPVPSPVIKALQKHAFQKDYLPVKGLLPLRQAVADFNQRKLGLDCSAEDILIGPGSKELIYNLQMAYDGDVLLPNPSWVSYAPQAHLLNKKVWWIETKEEENWRVSPEHLDQLCASCPTPHRILILNYPNNPTGTTYSPKQLESLADVCRKHNVLVIADEIYGEVHHSSPRVSLSQFYPEGTIISEGLSKWCGAGGWRLGTFTFPKEYRWLLDAMAKIASETYSSVSAPIQYAAVEAFKPNEEILTYLQHSRKILSAVANFVYQQLREVAITMPAPEGGFYLFPNFGNYRSQLAKKGIKNSTQLCEKLLEETGVALLPSVAFGRPPEELTARLAFVDFDGERLLEKLGNGAKPEEDMFIKNNCPQILKATQLIRNWLPR